MVSAEELEHILSRNAASERSRAFGKIPTYLGSSISKSKTKIIATLAKLVPSVDQTQRKKKEKKEEDESSSYCRLPKTYELIWVHLTYQRPRPRDFSPPLRELRLCDDVELTQLMHDVSGPAGEPGPECRVDEPPRVGECYGLVVAADQKEAVAGLAALRVR
ncbi:hypothetical protein BC936DRAFT_146186 [Jimgerdemannia flammicorona]|uniref:Uncharacterized protein n=1 Tax=Jimgerdemannia flammicorona TaxID=994334 RepID=A0A433D877_9FUNG|nr:hypothetical protein BC936DRAFT_146186 [Jimgerdemannia flammicorona]